MLLLFANNRMLLLAITTILLVCISSPIAEASQWPLRMSADTAPVSNTDIPATFDCLMRQAAYAYGKKLIPRHGDFSALYWALDLKHCVAYFEEEAEEIMLENDDIKDTTAAESRRLAEEHQKALDHIPQDAVFVTVNGNDDLAKGTEHSPFQSLQKAIDYAVQHTTSKHVMVRGGVHYLKETLQLTSAHNDLQIMGYPGESAVLSGGQRLSISKWEPYEKTDLRHNAPDDKANIWVTNLAHQIKKGDEMPGLQINGKRSTVARYPNLLDGIEVSCGYGCMVDSKKANWTPPVDDKNKGIQHYTDSNATRARPNAGWFEHYTIGVHGNCDVYDPPVSYWCSENPSGGGAFAFITPSAMTPNNKDVLPHAPYSKEAVEEDARLFVWRPERWANWMFKIEDYDPTTNHMKFGAGGNQGARGERSGGDWFIENLLEELDAPNEFYYDTRMQNLYLYYNGTGAPPKDATFVVPKLRTIIHALGTQWDTVRNVKIEGVTFTSTRFTFMDPHGVPSGGDWALERSGAVFFQGTQNITIENCTFDRLDSNGIMISGFNRNTTVSHSDFTYIGGTAIASWGYTNETDTDPGRPGVHLENAPEAGVDGTDGEHPRYNTIKSCTIREVGLYEKQASFYMQAKTAYTTLTGNVFFNGPRAGINFNDGFVGGDEVSHNLVFSTCRESGDHGPFNSWDRQPFWTLKDGQDAPSMYPEWRKIHHNFLIDNYSPQENVDNDDGSMYFHTHDNFMVYGGNGMKNDFGGHDNHHYGNIYAYVGQALGICAQLPGHEDHFINNRVIMTGEKLGEFQCDGPGSTVMGNNSYYTASGNVTECKMSLPDWQKQGKDVNSMAAKYPKDEEIIQWAKDLLGF